jgi:hypothetical protein
MNESKPLAVVTGASSGIGAAFARELAAEGYDLVLVARRKNRLRELATELENSHSITAEVLAADLTNDAELRLVEERIARADNLEFLVNNAGFGTLGRFFEAALGGQDKMHRLHVVATVRLTHAALTGMVARRKGNVVNISSVAAFAPYPGNTSYCATKRWMNSFTEGLCLELKSQGSPVRVQALCPGFTISEFHDTLGVDRKRIPDSLWMSAEFVVAASLRGLARGKLLVVPGWRYQFFVFVLGLLPTFLRHALALRYARRAQKEGRIA